MNYVTFTRRGHPRASVESMRERGEREATRRACGGGSPLRAALGVLAAAALAACNGGGSVNIANSQTSDPATVDYPIFYVKHTVPTTTAGTLAQDDLRIMQEVNPSADLYMRAAASPSAVETNITARVTAGASWDVKDVDTSADGTLVIFAMRGPLAKNQPAKDPPSWRIWQYTIASDTLAPVINPADDPDPPTVDDVSPHYLPDGRIVFSTTRQDQSQGVLLNQGDPQFSAQDEDRTEPAFVLEVMNPDGTAIHQITFNQSHDRDATVLANGRVLWARWDNMPAVGRNQMSLYSSNPDGTDMELYYGVNSHNTGTNASVIEFVHPHQMQDGRILALARQFTDVDDGGNLVIIDGTRYVENTQSLLAYPGLTGPAQVPATPDNVVTLPGPSPGGRFMSAVPLQDGTNRILVSWSQCRLLDTTTNPPTIVACTGAALAAPKPQVALPLYSVWMFDPSQNTMLPIMSPVEGVMITDVAVAQPRPLPNIIPDQVAGVTLNQSWVNAGVGVIDIRSVYDFDGVDKAVPNIATLANPALTPASARPARFVRLEKAVAIPPQTLVNLSDAAFGASNYMIEILGYAPIEPDGSVRIQVPAQVAFRMSVLDADCTAHHAGAGRVAAGAAGRGGVLQRLPPAAGRRAAAAVTRAQRAVRIRLGRCERGRRALPEHHHHADHYRQRHNSHAIDPDRRRGDHGAGAHGGELRQRQPAVRADGAECQRDLHRRVDQPGGRHAESVDLLPLRRLDRVPHALPDHRAVHHLVVLELPHRDQLPRAHPAAVGPGAAESCRWPASITPAPRAAATTR